MLWVFFIDPASILQTLLQPFKLQVVLLAIFLWLSFALTIQNLEVKGIFSFSILKLKQLSNSEK